MNVTSLSVLTTLVFIVLSFTMGVAPSAFILALILTLTGSLLHSIHLDEYPHTLTYIRFAGSVLTLSGAVYLVVTLTHILLAL